MQATRAEVKYAKCVRTEVASHNRINAASVAVNATHDEQQELVLLLQQRLHGVNLVIPSELQDAFDSLQCMTDVEELAWPSRTFQLVSEAPGIPAILAGVLDNELMCRMHMRHWKTNSEAPVVCVLLHTSGSPTEALQCMFTKDDLKRIWGDDAALPEHFEDDDKQVMLSAVRRVMRALLCVNTLQFNKREQEDNALDTFVLNLDTQCPTTPQ